MRSSSLAIWLASICLGACGDIDVKSVRTGDVVPADLEGEWRGEWHSGQANTSGLVTMRLQDFQGEPIVSINIDNPCVQPREYDFAASGTSIELRANGETVFAAVLGANRTLVGTYECAADVGTWNVAWQQSLPPVIDITGDWDGMLSAAGGPGQVLALRLDQFVRGGALAVAGSMRLPGLLSEPVHLAGSVQFREGAFDLVLATLPEVSPIAVLTGLGQSEPLAIEGGVLQVLLAPGLPPGQGVWGQGLWTAVWRQR